MSRRQTRLRRERFAPIVGVRSSPLRSCGCTPPSPRTSVSLLRATRVRVLGRGIFDREGRGPRHIARVFLLYRLSLVIESVYATGATFESVGAHSGRESRRECRLIDRRREGGEEDYDLIAPIAVDAAINAPVNTSAHWSGTPTPIYRDAFPRS